jgi:hypothetical protein
MSNTWRKSRTMLRCHEIENVYPTQRENNYASSCALYSFTVPRSEAFLLLEDLYPFLVH